MKNLLKHTTKSDGLDLQSPGRNLTDKRVTDSSNRQLVHQRPTKHDTASCDRSLPVVRLGDKTKETQHEEHAEKTAQSVQVQSSTSNTTAHQEPGAKYASHVDSVLSEGKPIGIVVAQAGLLEEIRRVV